MVKPLKDIIDEHRELNERNKRLIKDVLKWKKTARYDDLTGLMRRGTFDTLMERLVQRSKRIGTPLSYILVDIDHFKKVNDTYGHDTGDEVLKEVSYLLNEGIRYSDIVARKFTGRIGGEEIALVLPGTDSKGASVVAERLRKSIEKHFKGKKVKITISAGVSSYTPEEGEGVSKVPLELYKTADKKLYEAKDSGRNKVVY
ncbi:GGDEF domain-containing protein [archaeon]|nr:GGDEF domain-containing protein [archaeon]